MVWVCEIMSQQTQVSRVAEYFTRWISKWPTVQVHIEQCKHGCLDDSQLIVYKLSQRLTYVTQMQASLHA